jgi:hypothetical protein
LTIQLATITICRSASGFGGACNLACGVQLLTGICATGCEATIGGFAVVSQPEARSMITKRCPAGCRATIRGGALALQKTFKLLQIDNLNITSCSSPSGSAIEMEMQDKISFVGFRSWNDGFAIGAKGEASSCVFHNSTFAPIKGDIFNAVSCRFKEVGPFEGFVTVHKCEFSGADLLGAGDVGGNVFDAEINPPEQRCPTPTLKISPFLIAPYHRNRAILQVGLFASSILLLA